MRNMILSAMVFLAGCGGDASVVKTASNSPIGKAVVVKPNANARDKGQIMLVFDHGDGKWESPLFLEAFRGVVLDELPEVYYEGKLDDGARWKVKVEDGPAAGRTGNVYKNQVDLMPIK